MPQNIQLANAAKNAIDQAHPSPEYGNWFPTRSGMCQMFVRLVVQGRYGSKHDSLIWQPSAIEAAHAFLEDGRYIVQARGWQDTELGNIIYKTRRASRWGHVGIRTWGNMIAENSSTDIGRIRGALGYRTMSEFANDFDYYGVVVVRLPEEI